MVETNRVPLYCKFREVILGKKFAAGVEVHCRVIADPEEGGWWLYGVNPGAIAASGTDLSGAVADFRSRFKGVLFDFASESDNFEAFGTLVRKFFKATDTATERDWCEAREAVRSGKADMPGMHRDVSNDEGTVKVVKLRLSPTENILDNGAVLAA